MTEKRDETEKLIQELEALRGYLLDEHNAEAETTPGKAAEAPSQKAPETLAQKPASVSYLNIKSAPHISEAMKEELRSQAAPIIQAFIDRELIKLEQQLIERLNHYLENWMDGYNSSQQHTDNQTQTNPQNPVDTPSKIEGWQ